MSANMILHRGAREATIDEIARVVTPAPTDTWYPIPHLAVLEAVEETLEATAFGIQSRGFALSANPYPPPFEASCGRDGSRGPMYRPRAPERRLCQGSAFVACDNRGKPRCSADAAERGQQGRHEPARAFEAAGTVGSRPGGRREWRGR
jgi:hypothetical protein